MSVRTCVFVAATAALAACASTPAPVIYGPDGKQSVRANARYEPPRSFGPPGASGNPPQGPFQPNKYLRLCPGMRVSNAPPADELLWVAGYKPIIVVGDVVMATIPVNDVCLSSGFGWRDTRMHEGIDVTSRPAGLIYSAAPGVIIEMREATGYGLQVLMGHGGGIFSRYAHLEYFADGLAEGQIIGFGQPLGLMGQSGNAQAVHLHYEILRGDYNNPRASKGLQPLDPFSFPAYEILTSEVLDDRMDS